MILSTALHLTAALVLGQDPIYQNELPDGSEPPPQSFGEASFEVPPQDWYDDFDAEPVSSLGIRPGVPHTGVDAGGGNATVTFPNPIVITINPPRIGFPMPGYSTTPRTIRVPGGMRYTGPDRNRNRIPDDLEQNSVVISNQ